MPLILGTTDDDTLTGSGNDTLEGLSGNDTYIAGPGDVLVEMLGAGRDTLIFTGSTIALPENIENLKINDIAGAVGTGNELENILSGNNGADTLDGGTNVDILAGGAGNDFYYVDNLHDLVMELGNSGNDTVASGVDYDLMQAWHVENLILTGSAINGFGNWLNNVVAGNDQSNLLDGNRGNDTLIGGSGDDVLIWDSADGSVQGGTGLDTLRVSGAGVTLDLAAVADSVITDIEIVDITGAGNNTLSLSATDVLAISSTTDVLRVDGNQGDSVNAAGDWTALLPDIVIGSNTYAQYMLGNAVLQVDVNMGRSGINVVGSNTVPEGADTTITIDEDGNHVFSANNFGFSDVDVGSSFQAVRIDTLPVAGSLKISGVDVTAGQVISVANLGNLVFAPAPNGAGNGYASFSFSVRDNAGAFDPSANSILFNVTAQADSPVVGGSDSGTVSEDGILQATGTLTVSDPDAGESVFQVQTGVASTYGSFSVNAAGAWSYNLNNSASAVQALGLGETLTDTMTVLTADSTPTNVTVTISGANDTPVVGGVSAGSVTEDGTLTSAGVLTIADIDDGQSVFQVQNGVATDYGTFSVNSAGSWTYDLNNDAGAVQALGAGQTLTDTVSLLTADGTSANVIITINGANEGGGDIEAPVLTGVSLSDNGNTVVLAYNEALSATTAATGAFTVTTGQLITDMPPSFQSAARSADGSKIILTYSESLSATTAAAGDFEVLTIPGGLQDAEENLVTAVTIVGRTVELTLTTALVNDQLAITTVAYADPTIGNDANALQDAAGNDAASLAPTRVGYNGVDVASGNGDLFVSLTTTANTSGHGTAAFDLGFTMSQAQTWNGIAGLQLEWNLATGAFTSNNSTIAVSNATLGTYGSALDTFRSLSAYSLPTAQFSVLAFDATGAGSFGAAGQSVMSTANLIGSTGNGAQPGATFGPTNSAIFSTSGNSTVLSYNSLMNADPGMNSTAVGSNTAVNAQNDHYNANSGMQAFGALWSGYDNNGQFGGSYAAGSTTFAGQAKAIPFFQFFASSLTASGRSTRAAFGVDLDNDGTIEFDNNAAVAGGNNEFGLWSLQGDILSYKNPGTVGVNAVSGVTVNGNTVELALTSPVSGQSVTVAYSDPTSGNDTDAVQDVAGNDASGLSARTLLYGSAGGDNLLLDADAVSRLGNLLGVSAIAAIDGRGGIDTLQFNGSGIVLDLTAIDAVIDSIERIDLTGNGNNTLTLSLAEVLVVGTDNVFNAGNTTSGLDAVESSVQLRVEGDTGDTVILTDLSAWGTGVPVGTVTANGQDYHVYEHAGGAQLLIDQDINVTAIALS